MSSDSQQQDNLVLRIAESLKAGEPQPKIMELHKTTPQMVSAVRKMVESGEVMFDATGAAKFSQAAARDVDRIHAVAMDTLKTKVVEKAIGDVEKDFILGNLLRTSYQLKAEKAAMTIDEYVTNAMMFYDDYRLKIEELEQGRALIDTAKMFIRRGATTLKRMELYGKFVDRLMLMSMRGIAIPAELPNQFMDDLKTIEAMELVEEQEAT